MESLICKHCAATYTLSKNSRGHFCTVACANKSRRTGQDVPCMVCTTKVWRKPAQTPSLTTRSTQYAEPALITVPSVSTQVPLSSAEQRETYDMARLEFRAVLCVLQHLELRPETAATLRYVDAVEAALLATRERHLNQVLPWLVDTFRRSRAILFDDIEDIQTWVLLAQAVDPDADAVIPRRFISTAGDDSIDFDADGVRNAQHVADLFDEHA